MSQFKHLNTELIQDGRIDITVEPRGRRRNCKIREVARAAAILPTGEVTGEVGDGRIHALNILRQFGGVDGVSRYPFEFSSEEVLKCSGYSRNCS